MHVVFDTLIVVAILAIAVFAAPRVSINAACWRNLCRWTRRNPVAFLALFGGYVLVFEVALGTLVKIPRPTNTDEFSFLLAADTFAHGRLTNPTHPLWEHFEAANIIHLPSYQSKYPPAQGAALAVGQWLCGRPIVGVWLSMAAACTATMWMLLAWLPRRWALWGGLLLLLNAPWLTIWGQTYWGGAVAMTGGALLFGSIRRLARRASTRDAVWLGVGLILLANSRPYEGLVASLPVAAALVWLSWRQPREVRAAWLRRVAVPMAGLLLLGGSWMAYYNARVTGDVWKMPYQVWLETYSSPGGVASTLFFLAYQPKVAEPPSRMPYDPPTQDAWNRWRQKVANVPGKLFTLWAFFASVLLTVPCLAALRRLASPWTGFAALSAGLVVAAVVLQSTHGYAHYAAPAASLFLFLIVQGFRTLNVWRIRDRWPGRFAVVGLAAACCLAFAVNLVQIAVNPNLLASPVAWVEDRDAITRRLAESGGRHVVLVRYPRRGDLYFAVGEWVYNPADIDGAAVVWARDLGEDANARLIDYYRERRVWRLDPLRGKLQAVNRTKGTNATHETKEA